MSRPTLSIDGQTVPLIDWEIEGPPVEFVRSLTVTICSRCKVWRGGH